MPSPPKKMFRGQAELSLSPKGTHIHPFRYSRELWRGEVLKEFLALLDAATQVTILPSLVGAGAVLLQLMGFGQASCSGGKKLT